jgi:hypothetical protein
LIFTLRLTSNKHNKQRAFEGISNNMQPTRLLTLLFLLCTLLVGCRESAQQNTDGASNAAASISVEFTRQPAQVGDDQLYVHVTDSAGSPLPLAQLSLRGDMSHAGMEPVVTSYEAPEPDDTGTYVIPFNWTMGGDWTLTVEATLQDGTTISEQVDLVVES